jgi:hypothetical protein
MWNYKWWMWAVVVFENDLKVHWKMTKYTWNHHSLSTTSSIQPCKFCFKKFSNLIDARDHMIMYIKMWEVKNLKHALFSSKSEFPHHHWSHRGDQPFKCELCVSTFTKRSLLIAHRKMHLDTVTELRVTIGEQLSIFRNVCIVIASFKRVLR